VRAQSRVQSPPGKVCRKVRRDSRGQTSRYLYARRGPLVWVLKTAAIAILGLFRLRSGFEHRLTNEDIVGVLIEEKSLVSFTLPSMAIASGFFSAICFGTSSPISAKMNPLRS
jgi:hypothetical protein